MAGMALGGIHFGFAWQAWHLETSTCILRGTWRHTPWFFAWQAWHLRGRHGTIVLRGRIGIWFLPLAFCVAGVTWRSLFVTYIFHTPSLSDTVFHTQLCHTPSFTHNFVTHQLSHTTLSHTIFHTQLVTHITHHLSHTTCHPQLVTHNFVTHHLSHTIFHGTTN